MLVELAIGDAYGACFEYAPVPFVKAHNGKPVYVNHPTHRQGPGRYTDDTQMSIAVAEALIDHVSHGKAFSPETLADKFVECFKRDVRGGYAGGFYHFLMGISSGKEFLEKIRPDSDKSGAAMRACPLGILPDVDDVMAKCEMQAKLTHNTRDGINAALAASLLVYFAKNKIDHRDLAGKWIDGKVPGYEWDSPWTGKVGSKGWMSVRAAITAFCECSNEEELLYRCVDYTGDVDTVATVAMAAASEHGGDGVLLPHEFYNGLENGKYGYDYLLVLDQRLDVCR
jgi:ADP-ribosyl-[dinitrogen reductase] hydrolase